MRAVTGLRDVSTLDGSQRQVSFQNCRQLATMITPTNPGVCVGELDPGSLILLPRLITLDF